MNDDDTKTLLGIAIAFGCFVLLVVVIGFFTSWFGLVTDRPQQIYKEQTRKEVRDNSIEYQDGMKRDIARYCEQMRDTSRPMSSRKAVAALMRSNASTYDGPLTDDNQTCLSEAKEF